MSGYSIIPICALLCYVFLLLAFLAAKKDKLINSFIVLLCVFCLWTLGSFCLRLQAPPSTKVWFYVSIDGLFLICYAYSAFIDAFTEHYHKTAQRIWLFGSVFIIVINHITDGIFIGAPKVLQVAGETKFVYSTTWLIVLPLLFNAIIIVYCMYMLLVYGKATILAKQQIWPIVLGLNIIFIGNVLASLPAFYSFPIDIVSGVINAFMMFYALYNKRLFRLTLLVSRSACYLIAAVLSVVLFSYLTGTYSSKLVMLNLANGRYAVLIIAVLYTLCVLVLYYFLKRFVDHVFIKDEIRQTDFLNDFSTSITKTLKVDEILSHLIQVIQETLHAEKCYICLLDFAGTSYKVVKSTSPLDEKTLVMAKDNPLVLALSKMKESILLEDFKRTSGYKAMWEKEKRQLEVLEIQCIFPLLDENELIGIVLLSGKDRGSRYSVEDLGYLQSLGSVCSMAVKNSRLYEKAYWEARTDHLTGLLNRNYFYETLHKEFNIIKDKELSLILLSLDDFKLFNQLYGTKTGDEALVYAAKIITASVGNNGYCARYDGKIFAIILPGYDILAARQIAEVIRKQIMVLNRSLSDVHIVKTLTCSCGICAIPMGASSVNEIINNADLALYNAKKNGKNCTKVYSPGSTTEKSSTVVEAGSFKPNIYEEYAATIYALTAAIDAKDHYTFRHSQNVCYYAMELARGYGLDDDCIEIIKEAALLHDIGKISIGDKILQKNSRLTPEEYEIMKGHVEHSIEIIRHLPSLNYVIPAVLGHHERYDGNGYPRGLKGEEIPLMARILCIADSFDAMVSKRIYKDPCPLDYALNELLRCSGTQFCPKLAPIFVELVNNNQIEVCYDKAD